MAERVEPQPVSTLLRSQLRCPKCDDLISSIHRHDFRTCECGALSIDGGRDYLRIAADDEVMALFMDEDERQKINQSISISGEHNLASAAAALAVYKALWAASARGKHAVSTPEVVDATETVGNGQRMPRKSVEAYLKMFADADGPVKREPYRNGSVWTPLVPLHERPDA